MLCLKFTYLKSQPHLPGPRFNTRYDVLSSDLAKTRNREICIYKPDRSEIWQAPRQHCCRSAWQISKRFDELNYQSRGFETSWDLTIRRLIGYWNGALGIMSEMMPCLSRYVLPHRKKRSVRVLKVFIPKWVFLVSRSLVMSLTYPWDITRLIQPTSVSWSPFYREKKTCWNPNQLTWISWNRIWLADGQGTSSMV